VKRSERHHLKQNDLLHWLEQFAGWAAENRSFLKIGGIAVLVAAVVVGGIYVYRHGRDQAAETALSEALEVYHGVVREDSIISGPDAGPTFNSREERYVAALEALEDVEQKYTAIKQGREARFYMALSKAGLGELEQSEALLEDVVDKRGDLLYYLASQTLATVKADRGDHASAAELYRTLVDDAKGPLPKDQLLFRMAEQLEADGKLREARQIYTRFLEEYPTSSLRSQAQQKSELLEFRLKASPA
jgi:tetratricopeptide (TPR) repeat protein